MLFFDILIILTRSPDIRVHRAGSHLKNAYYRETKTLGTSYSETKRKRWQQGVLLSTPTALQAVVELHVNLRPLEIMPNDYPHPKM